jgi:endoglucanase
MQRKLLFGCVVLLAAYAFCSAERYARFNEVGYFPKSPKRIVIMSDDDCAGARWNIMDQNKKSVLSGVLGKSVFGKGDHTPLAFNYEIDFSSLTNEGSYGFEMPGISNVVLNIKKDLLRPVVASNLRFFYVLRSGSKNCLDREPGHFGDSASVVFHRKGKENSEEFWGPGEKKRKINMLGGWYDGYLYTKYTLTNAYAAYFLLRSYELNPSLFVKKYSATDLVDVLDNAKWGLDYLCKVMPADNEFIIEVGGWKDNETGIHLPPSDPLNGKRECYSAISVPQMGLTAAALALGGSVFGGLGHKADAEKYTQAAVKIFTKAAASTAENAWLEKDGTELYKDESWADDMELAAIELFRTTKDQAYLSRALKYASSAKAAGWIAWSDLHLAAHERVLEHSPQTKKYILEDLDDFQNAATSNGNIWSLPIEYTPQGLHSCFEAASGALGSAGATKEKKYERFAFHVIDYALGCNNWGLSFVSLASVPKSARNYYSQIYRLQTRLFPEGAIAGGPLDTKTQKEDVWCCFDRTAEPTYPFNTDKVSFYDNSDDEACTNAILTGVADGIYLFTLASKLYGE